MFTQTKTTNAFTAIAPGCRIAGACIAACLAMPAPLQAHTLLISRGEVTVHADHIAVFVDVNVADFLHLFGLTPDDHDLVSVSSIVDAVDQHADDLAASLYIWDERGMQITGGAFAAQWEPPPASKVSAELVSTMYVRFTGVYRLRTQPRLLTYCLRIDQRRPGIPRQLALIVRDATQTNSRTMYLTSRANAETIELHWCNNTPTLVDRHSLAPPQSPCDSRDQRTMASLGQILVDVDVTASPIQASILIPLPLLETWIVPTRTDPGRLTPGDRAKLEAAANMLVRDALVIEQNGRPLLCDLTSSRIIAAGVDESAPDNIGFFTSRFAATARFAPTAPADRLTLRWTLFNGAVLRALVTIKDHEHCLEREFSTYQPFVQWHAGMQTTDSAPAPLDTTNTAR